MLISYIIKGILGHKLPWALVLLGVMIAVTLEMTGVPSLAFAVGVYLPLSSSSPIWAGGIVRWLVDAYHRRKHQGKNLSEDQLAAEGDKSPGVLLASGYIAGGAIAGIVIALMQGTPRLSPLRPQAARLGDGQQSRCTTGRTPTRSRWSFSLVPVRVPVPRRPGEAPRAEEAPVRLIPPMADDREAIMAKVRGALAPLKAARAMPDYDGGIELARSRAGAGDPMAEFAERLGAVNGEVVAGPAALAAALRSRGWTRGYCDPALWPRFAPHFGADFTVETRFDRSRVDDYQFGITRGAGAIAETGTIILERRDDLVAPRGPRALGARRRDRPRQPVLRPAGGRGGARAGPERGVVHGSFQDGRRRGHPDRGRARPGRPDRPICRLTGSLGQAGSSTTGLVSVPMPSISTATVSPAFR